MSLVFTCLYQITNAQNDYNFFLENEYKSNRKNSNPDFNKLKANENRDENSKSDAASLNNSRKITSGTGFALANNGLIVTDYHVIAGCTSINVKGINGNFSSSYKAKVITSDLQNDLAIIQINDSSFTGISKIPYVIKTSGSNVGENIFVLGYPLRATMGDEIKLTNGIINSESGFQGDPRAYQVSASIQPGSSGGPLFNKEGELIGIIKSKHIGAENVAYAIKASYLKKLIELLPQNPLLNNKSKFSHLSLSKQAKILSGFVYIIEIK